MATRPRTTTDVAVVGGGIIGGTVAWRLAQRGLAVTLLDRGDPHAGAATPAAAGMLAPALEHHRVRALADLCLASHARYPSFVAELEAATGATLDYQACGAVQVALSEPELSVLDTLASSASDRGIPVTRLTAAEARSLEPRLGNILAALHFPREGVVDPRRLAAAVRQAAIRAGVVWRAPSDVKALHTDGTGDPTARGVTLASGERLLAERVVLAAGSWSSAFDPGLPPASVRPVRGQIVVLAASAPLTRVIAGGDVYLAPRSDGRVLVGSTMEDVGFVQAVTAGALATLCAGAVALVPSLATAHVVDSWCGFRPASADGLPLIGRVQSTGLFVATGHHRNGILLAPLTAELVTKMILDDGATTQHAS